MKKNLSIILIIILLLFITSCGRRNEEDDTTVRIDTDNIIDKYLNGEWDGLPTEIDGHTISLSEQGCLLIDGGYLSETSNYHLDIPVSMYSEVDSCNTIYIPGKGTYLLMDTTYVKYLRGKEILLPGSFINWKEGEGIDVDYGHAILHYNETYDKLFLTTPMLDIYDDESETFESDPSYLYVFPDYNIAEIQFIGRCKSICNETSFSYVDENNVEWIYNKEEKFEKK